MKNLLVAFELTATCEAPWNTELSGVAHQIASLFDSYIEVVGISPPLPSAVLADEMSWSAAAALTPCSDQDARIAFERAFQMPQGLRACSWSGLLAPQSIGAHARVFDLTIMARPNLLSDQPSRGAVENALFDTGRPVLLVSERVGKPDGAIVISWTDTVETARAITSSMPLLRLAKSVHLVSVQKQHEPPPQAERAVNALLRDGIRARCSIVAEHDSVGKTIVDFAQDLNADILIKGAYTQTRLRRLIFGGATEYVLSHCAIPLLLAH